MRPRSSRVKGAIVSEAERLLNTEFAAAGRSWAVIPALRLAVDLGLPFLRDQIRAEMTRILADEGASEFVDIEGLKSADLHARVVEGVAAFQVNSATWAVDAATVVFAHSIVDNAATQYLRVAALAAPHDWAPFLDQRKLPLRDMRERNYAEVLREKINGELDDLSRQSLTKRIDRLHALCPPTPNLRDDFDYAFDGGRIERFDKDRQDVVHGDRLGVPFPNLHDDLRYLKQTTSYFMALVALRHNLKLDPQFLLGG